MGVKSYQWWQGQQRKSRQRSKSKAKWQLWRERLKAAIAFCERLDLSNPMADPAAVQKNLARLQLCAAHVRFSFNLQMSIVRLLNFLGRKEDAIAVILKVEQVLSRKDVSDTRRGCVYFTTLGLLLDHFGDSEASMRVLSKGLASSHPPPNIDLDLWSHHINRARFALGRQLYLARDFDNALRYLQDIDSPRPAVAHYYLACTQLMLACNMPRSEQKQAALEEALIHCQTYLKSIRDSDALFLMGRIYMRLEDYENGARWHAEAASLAEQDRDFEKASHCWWASGCLLTDIFQRHQEAIVQLKYSVDAALQIQDMATQAKFLFCALAWLRKSESSVDSTNTVAKWKTVGEDYAPSRVEALFNLGDASLRNRMFNEARQYFQDAISLIDEELKQSEDFFDQSLLFQLQWGLARVSDCLGEHDEAISLYMICKKTTQSEETKLRCDLQAAMVLTRSFRLCNALEKLTQISKGYSTLLEEKWDLKAELLLWLGKTFFGMGNRTEALLNLETARMILEEKEAFDTDTIGLVYLAQFYTYMENQQIWDGFQLAKSFRVILNASTDKDRNGLQQTWQYMCAVAYSMVANYEEGNETLTNVLEALSNSEYLNVGQDLTIGILVNLGNAYRHLGDFDSALTKYEEAANLVSEKDVFGIGHIYINRGSLYMQMAEAAATQALEEEEIWAAMQKNWEEAYNDYCKVISLWESLSESDANSLAIAYAGQALILCFLKKPDAGLEKVENARCCAGNNRLLLAKLKYIEAFILHKQEALEEAQSKAREAASLYSTIQMELQDLDSAWVSLLGGEMKYVFHFLQKLCIDLDDYRQALLWAERGRMRLYFRAKGQSAQLDPLCFDKDDKLATECIHQAIKGCSSQTAVIEYTFSEAHALLYVYVVQEQEFGLSVNFEQVCVRDFFAIKSNCISGRTLNALIMQTRSEIRRCADSKAKRSLSILYRLLVEPVWHHISANCSTIIFSPHESLFLVPFAALYNNEQNLFLIEDKAVGIIPSIRTLQQCLKRQLEFEDGMRESRLGPAFVAADPQPMGLGLHQLEEAAEEARNVAKILGVKPLIGKAVTKQAVIKGMSNSYVIVLATHGIVDSCFPQGALVMQGQEHVNQTQALETSIQRSLLKSKMAGGPTREFLEAMPRASEVLTADELGKLEAGIHAGLVVLSACQTGEGKVSSEGLLGLGRAVLEAGASSAALMLWKVNDESTKDLVTKLFQHLGDGQTVAASMQLAMLQMLRSGSNIYNWAPLIAFGSPTVKLIVK